VLSKDKNLQVLTSDRQATVCEIEAYLDGRYSLINWFLCVDPQDHKGVVVSPVQWLQFDITNCLKWTSCV